MLERLSRGRIMLAPRDPWATPIRVLLGDSGVTHRDSLGTGHGIRVEVFSRDLISPDFTPTTTNAATGWSPGGTGPSAVRYPSEWSRIPVEVEKGVLEANGVDVSLVPWWSTLQSATEVSPVSPADGRLNHPDGVVHYDPDEFMEWLNRKTWRSEWPKYGVTDPAGVPAGPRPGPA